MKNKNHKKLRVGINASFARKPNTGMGQVTINFLKTLREIQADVKDKNFKNIEFILYLEEDLSKSFRLPKNFTKKIFLPLWRRDDLFRRLWWEESALPEKVYEDKCDVLISLYQSATVLLPSKKIKHIMVVHDIIPKILPEYLNNWRKEIYQIFLDRGIKKSDKIVAVSKRTEKDLIQRMKIKADKITVSYIDVDEIFKKKPSKETNQKVLKKYKLAPGYILAGGGLEMRKNITGVVQAYKYLTEKIQLPVEVPPLIIYGKLLPELAPIVTDAEKLLKELNLTKKVKLLDAVPQKDLPTIFQNASMFVYPSFYEGFGMPPLEAMNIGTPVILSKASSLPEVGLDSALYCDPNDIYDIAMVMRNVLMNKEMRETLSSRGKTRAKSFSWKKFTEKLLNVIENIQ